MRLPLTEPRLGGPPSDHLPLVIFESSLGCHDWAASDLSTSTARRRIWDGDSQLCASVGPVPGAGYSAVKAAYCLYVP